MLLLGVVREGERPRCFLRCKHTPQAIGPAAAKTQHRRAPSTLAAAASRGQGLCCLVLCVLGACVCVWSPTMSGTKRCRVGLVHKIPGLCTLGSMWGPAAELPGTTQNVNLSCSHSPTQKSIYFHQIGTSAFLASKKETAYGSRRARLS